MIASIFCEITNLVILAEFLKLAEIPLVLHHAVVFNGVPIDLNLHEFSHPHASYDLSIVWSYSLSPVTRGRDNIQN